MLVRQYLQEHLIIVVCGSEFFIITYTPREERGDYDRQNLQNLRWALQYKQEEVGGEWDREEVVR